MPQVTIIAATLDHLLTYQRDRTAFAALLGSDIPDGWPEFPESIDFTIDRLRAHPEEADWWMHFFLHDGRLVGSGGFTGPPEGGTVEIGYEIAPSYRQRGFATEAARAMIEKASATGDVTTIIAHTLATDNPSTAVLRRLNFSWDCSLEDPEEGQVWRWRLPVP